MITWFRFDQRFDYSLGWIKKKSEKVVGNRKQSLKGSMISQELIRSILGRYTLPLEGAHGVIHGDVGANASYSAGHFNQSPVVSLCQAGPLFLFD